MTLQEMIKKTGCNRGAFYSKTTSQRIANVAERTQQVDTIINGIIETSNIALEGDYIVSGLKGEKYVMPKRNFEKLYEHLSGNTYQTKPDTVQAVQVNEEFSFTAPWGSEMNVLPGDYIIFRSFEDSYRVEREAFEQTYELED